MYRNLYYNIPKNNITLWTWNDKGKRCTLTIPVKPYIYVENESNPDALSIYNTKLAKKSFINSWDRDKYIKHSGLKRVFYNIPTEQQFLIDMFGSKNGDANFFQYPLKTFFLDIETYSPGDFPNPKTAPDPINVITIYDSISKRFYTWGTGGKNGGNYIPANNVTYVKCKSESELLINFINFWRSNYPDIVSGWNSESFDIPYIINRIKLILGESMANNLSPVKELYCRENVITKYGKHEDHWYIKGISHLDYMAVYKTFSREKRERYTLDFIGEIELNQNKNPVPASNLPAFADNNWQKFCEYNIQDVNILVELEEALHYLQIVRKLAYMGYTSFEQALGTIAIVTGAMALKALNKGMIIPTFPITDVANYEGGFVREPQRGLRDSIVGFDANSLYPNTIISANISPETKIGKIINKTDSTVEVRLVNDKIYELPHTQFKQWVQTEQLAITKAKIIYHQKNKGFCPELLDSIYSERLENQKKLKKHKVDIKHCNKGSDMYIVHTKAIIELDVMQYTLKILMNRLYGAFANKHSPFYDIDAAASVTLTGQACIKESSDIINRFVEHKYGVTEDCTIYGDTDSYSSETKIISNKGEFSMEDLYNLYDIDNKKITSHGHELISLKNKDLNILTFISKINFVDFRKVKNLIRHKVTKKKYKVSVNGKSVVMTEDHNCIVIRNGELIRVPPKDIKSDDKMMTKKNFGYDISETESVKCIGTFDHEYVYDIEMEDNTDHTFFANDILVHNSVYITIDPILKKVNKKLANENGDITKDAYEIIEGMEHELNTKIGTWATNTCNIKDPRFVFKRETICNSGLFLEKKRYILHVLDVDGFKPDPEKEIKYTGVEVVSIRIPKKVKPLIKYISKTMLTTRNKKKTDEAFRQAYEEYLQLNVEDIATPTGINNYEKFENMANGFTIGNRTPRHVKSAIYYNHLLYILGIRKKYEQIVSGDDIKTFYVEPNKYNIKSIAFKDIYPKEFDVNIDKVFMFNKNVTPAVKRLYDAVGWTLNNPTKETECDLLELLG